MIWSKIGSSSPFRNDPSAWFESLCIFVFDLDCMIHIMDCLILTTLLFFDVMLYNRKNLSRLFFSTYPTYVFVHIVPLLYILCFGLSILTCIIWLIQYLKLILILSVLFWHISFIYCWACYWIFIFFIIPCSIQPIYFRNLFCNLHLSRHVQFTSRIREY